MSARLATQAAAADTGAIEHLYPHDRGFTISVATELAAWETQLAGKPANVRALLEAQLAAYELALDAATQAVPITEVLIRRLHEELTGPQETYKVLVPLGDRVVEQERSLPKGEYKDNPNHVRLEGGTYHAYAPLGMTRPEMHRLTAEISTEQFLTAHPVLQASYAHYALAAIHPFADGNGRTARALASIFLYRAVSIPLVVFAEQEEEYLDALAAADGGRPQPFVRFVLDRATDSMSLVADQLAPSPHEALARLREILKVGQSSTTYDELADLGLKAFVAVQAEFTAQLEALSPPQGISKNTQEYQLNHRMIRPHYVDNAKHRRGGLFWLSSTTPSASAQVEYRVLLGGADEPQPLAVEAIHDDGERRYLDFRLSEVQPELSSAAKVRLSAWVRGVLGETAERLTTTVKAAIGRTA